MEGRPETGAGGPALDMLRPASARVDMRSGGQIRGRQAGCELRSGGGTWVSRGQMGTGLSKTVSEEEGVQPEPQAGHR